jgi:hypothetical protein
LHELFGRAERRTAEPKDLERDSKNQSDIFISELQQLSHL